MAATGGGSLPGRARQMLWVGQFMIHGLGRLLLSAQAALASSRPCIFSSLSE
jgi:hypothetical protein